MSEERIFTLTVNGKQVQASVAPQTMLMDVLRDNLWLTGAKDGCATGHCGSCMVIKDGEAVRSCIVQMKRVDGANITTIEAVAGAAPRLHPSHPASISHAPPHS